jgi:acetyltransferase-like isoleucine patch superfamily enzyme
MSTTADSSTSKPAVVTKSGDSNQVTTKNPAKKIIDKDDENKGKDI